MNRIPLPQTQYKHYIPETTQDIGPINKFLGVTTLDPYNAELGFAAGIKNLSAARGVFPAMATRPDFAAVGAAFGAAVTGMGLHKNVELHAVAGGSWRRYSAGAWASLLSGLSNTAPWSFCNFKGNLAAINLIGVNGVDTPRKYDGVAITTLTGLPAGVNFKLIDQHTDRLYASDGKAVYYSAIAKPQDWTSSGESGAGVIQIETNMGEDVNAIKAGIKHLMVFKRNAFMELWGTRPSNYQLQRISESGAVGPDAVAVKDQTAYWINDGGVFKYTGGLPRNDFSLPVIGYFNQMNKAAASGACAVNTRDAVLFSIPTGASVVNDTTLEYLPDVGIWSVWQDFAPRNWLFWNNVLTYGDASGVFSAAGNGVGVAWEWISPPFGGRPFSNTHQWYQLWYVIDVPAGSTLSVYVSRKAEGNAPADWILANTVLSPSGSRKVILPLADLAGANYLRVKFVGTGPVDFHEINIKQREMPLR